MYYLKDFEGSVKLDFIGKFENMSNDFQKIAEKLNLPSNKLPHKLNSKNKKITYETSFNFNPGMDRVINEHFKEDIEYFKYTKVDFQ